MDMKQVKTFIVASECLNFTKCAEQLNYAQSTVTSQIKNLETELGVSLFERLGNKLVLTAPGQSFILHAKAILSQYNLAVQELQQQSTITIAATESQSTYKLPALLSEIRKLHPHTQIIMRPMHQIARIHEGLQTGEIDIAFLFSDSDQSKPSHIKKQTLAKGQIVLVASTTHTLVQQPICTIEDVKEETWIVTEKDCSYRNLLEHSLSLFNIKPRSTYEITTIEALKSCVKSGLGIALLPREAVAQEVRNGELYILNWAKTDDHSIHHHIIWHKDKQLTPFLKSLIEASKQQFSSHHSQIDV
ncbi:LysR family transcriptional regulator [Alkalicoccobacillus porphyridii]|uniref:LysR family transcriptional regulator n=1 Tax=Alkalicoccobacillus porphyridii TaxID=2597270 RepID=A0A554A1E0_9BACI|nr:LysR family transcriptional regulator [Alkalicoccobacillus porphyridii]TSB47510.1 LysR family transcriptional regulator [Alkalicoccobacillus porphyridii]